jgi:lysophospholipase L1-like esterase
LKKSPSFAANAPGQYPTRRGFPVARRFSIIFCLLLIPAFASGKTTLAEGQIVASYYDCWQPEPPPGWQVLTNSRGPIGDGAHYEPLTYVNESPQRAKWGANYYTDEAKTIRAGTASNRVPGMRDGEKRYAISAYTFSEDHPGDVWVTNGNLQGRNQGEGMDLKIYLNDTLKFETVAAVAPEPHLFQCNLGPVKKGDVAYVAFASEDANTLIVQLLYTIEAFAQGTVPPPPAQKIHPAPDAATPVLSSRTVKPDEEYLQKHQGLCDALLEQMPELVFIGDSITARLGTPDMLNSRFGKQYKPGMFAIGGDWMQNVLWRIENGPLEQVKPKAIVLLIGTNNVSKYTPDEVALGIGKIGQTLHRQTPESEIVLMGIFPRGESIHNNPAYEKIKQINKSLADLAEKTDKVVFLDIGDRLVETDGTISKEMMPDLLHVAPKGLDIWAEALTPVLARIFDSKP